jgi:tetratricopeptide (TPR) repeat protein
MSAFTLKFLPRRARTVLGCTGAWLLAACASQPLPQPDTPEPQPDTAAAVQAPVIYRPIPEDTLYSLLVAEFAARRGALDVAMNNYAEQAVATRDPGVAARATRMARYLGADRLALDAAQLWAEVEPENLEARFTAATELARAGSPLQALPHMLAVDRMGGVTNFAAISASALELEEAQRRSMLEQLDGIGGDNEVDALIGRAILQQGLDQNDEALAGIARALEIDPGNYQALLLEAQVYQNLGQLPRAFERIEQALAVDSENKRLRLQYARMLANTDLARAEEQFRILVEQNPEDVELRLSLAVVYRENGEFDLMREQLEALLAEGRQISTVRLYLGQEAERRELRDEAIAHYLEVAPSSVFMPAIARAAELLLDTHGEEALAREMRALRGRWPQQAQQLTLLQAELLTDHEALNSAHELLSKALQDTPEQPALLYARSMVSEKLRDLPALEQDLRAMLRLDPDSALALNALGYSLSNLSDRHAEALQLISRALELKPDDPAIIDSLGWVHYRLGNLQEALTHLGRAFELYPDHEVAAHLGEVLWVLGRQEEAHTVWAKGLQDTPDSRIIAEAMQRLGATAN